MSRTLSAKITAWVVYCHRTNSAFTYPRPTQRRQDIAADMGVIPVRTFVHERLPLFGDPAEPAVDVVMRQHDAIKSDSQQTNQRGQTHLVRSNRLNAETVKA